MGSSAKVDEEAFEACMKDVTRALLEARRGRRQPPPADTAGPKSDVNVASVVQLKKARPVLASLSLVRSLSLRLTPSPAGSRPRRQNVVKAVNIRELAAGLNPKNVIERAVFSELVRLVDGTCGGAAKPFSPKRGSPCVVMFVGLQGAGKTTTATKARPLPPSRLPPRREPHACALDPSTRTTTRARVSAPPSSAPTRSGRARLTS